MMFFTTVLLSFLTGILIGLVLLFVFMKRFSHFPTELKHLRNIYADSKVMNKLLMSINKGISLSDILKKHGFNNVAIYTLYNFKELGKFVTDEFIACEFDIKYIISRNNSKELYKDIKIINDFDIINYECVDVILVSDVYIYDDLKSYLLYLNIDKSVKVMSIWELSEIAYVKAVYNIDVGII